VASLALRASLFPIYIPRGVLVDACHLSAEEGLFGLAAGTRHSCDLTHEKKTIRFRIFGLIVEYEMARSLWSNAARMRYGFSLKSGFLTINAFLILTVCLCYVYFQWDDLGNWDFRYYAFGGSDFIDYPKLYDHVYLEKPPLAFLLYAPMKFLPGIGGQAVFFVFVIAAELLMLHRLLRELQYDESACLGGTVFFLAATRFKYQLDYVSLEHLTNLLILGACIAMVRGSKPGIIISGALITVSFYIRQNNVLFALYPLLLARFTGLGTVLFYAASMLGGFLILLGLFCLISNTESFLYTTFYYPLKYADIGIGGPPAAFSETVRTLALGKLSLGSLLFFFVLWSVATLTRTPLRVSGSRMLAIFAVGFAVMAAPNKAFNHYQGYLLIWLGLLGACAVHVLFSRLPPRRQGLLLWLSGVCAGVLVAAVLRHEIAASGDLSSAKRRLDRLMPELRHALASRPGQPTLQVFDPIYTDHGLSDGLVMALSGARPANPLFFTVLYGETWAAALPPDLRDQWGLLRRNPPDVVLLVDLDEAGSSAYVGPMFRRSVDQFLDSHAYRMRQIADKVVIAERPIE
jgi:hypothetical protein